MSDDPFMIDHTRVPHLDKVTRETIGLLNGKLMTVDEIIVVLGALFISVCRRVERDPLTALQRIQRVYKEALLKTPQA